MKVYVVYENEYESGVAEGVYSSRELALKAIEVKNQRWLRPNMDILEFELDAPIE